MFPTMKAPKIQDLPQAFASVLLSLMTSTYSGAYAYHTVNPIKNIQDHQQYYNEMLQYELIKALADFRRTKSEELLFVSKAVSPNHPPRHTCPRNRD
jgi:hypothetical protein